MMALYLSGGQCHTAKNRMNWKEANTMKRRALILSALALLAALFAAGTIAYFTAEGQAHNVITTGGVDIAVQEWADEDKTQPFQDPTGVMPGTTVTKIAEVKNTGAADAWVRVQVTQSIQRDKELYPNDGLVTLDYNTTDWTQGEDGYFYYNKVLKPGEVTEPIFTNVAFSGTMDNAYQGAQVVVDVAAQAVQTAHNGSTVTDAKGWPNA